jgi:hypothetical protein
MEYALPNLVLVFFLVFIFRRQIKRFVQGEPPRKAGRDELEKIVSQHLEKKARQQNDQSS